MSTVRDFRRQRLCGLIDATPGPPRGRQKRFAEAHGLVPAHVSQMVQGVRPMGDEVARRIEAAAGLPRGALDHPPATALAEPSADHPSRGDFLIPELNVKGSMGHGVTAPDHLDIVRQIRVNLSQLRREISFTVPGNLRVITGYGDSMKPTFSDGDPLIVDIGVNEITFDAVYVLERSNGADTPPDVYIKRVQRRPDGSLLMISDNKIYEPYVITERERGLFRVSARVLIAWNARKL